MPQTLIDGVRTRPTRLNADERGFLMEIMRPDWDVFQKFGQVYVTSAYPGVVKAWPITRSSGTISSVSGA